MINLEITERQAKHTYCRDHMRRIALYLLLSCFLSVILVGTSAYRLFTYPKRQTFISQTTGRIIPINSSPKPVYTGPQAKGGIYD